MKDTNGHSECIFGREVQDGATFFFNVVNGDWRCNLQAIKNVATAVHKLMQLTQPREISVTQMEEGNCQCVQDEDIST